MKDLYEVMQDFANQASMRNHRPGRLKTEFEKVMRHNPGGYAMTELTKTNYLKGSTLISEVVPMYFHVINDIHPDDKRNRGDLELDRCETMSVYTYDGHFAIVFMQKITFPGGSESVAVSIYSPKPETHKVVLAFLNRMVDGL